MQRRLTTYEGGYRRAMSQEVLGARKATAFSLDAREDDLRLASFPSIASRVKQVVAWCNTEGITALINLPRLNFRQFRLWRKERIQKGITWLGRETGSRTIRGRHHRVLVQDIPAAVGPQSGTLWGSGVE